MPLELRGPTFGPKPQLGPVGFPYLISSAYPEMTGEVLIPSTHSGSWPIARAQIADTMAERQEKYTWDFPGRKDNTDTIEKKLAFIQTVDALRDVQSVPEKVYQRQSPEALCL